MPTYQYECDACGHELEVFQSITGKKLRKCPECNRLSLKRLIGAGSGIIFKGSGFYETDYKRTGAPEPVTNTSKTTTPGKSDTAVCPVDGRPKECACAPVKQEK